MLWGYAYRKIPRDHRVPYKFSRRQSHTPWCRCGTNTAVSACLMRDGPHRIPHERQVQRLVARGVIHSPADSPYQGSLHPSPPPPPPSTHRKPVLILIPPPKIPQCQCARLPVKSSAAISAACFRTAVARPTSTVLPPSPRPPPVIHSR